MCTAGGAHPVVLMRIGDIQPEANMTGNTPPSRRGVNQAQVILVGLGQLGAMAGN